MDKNRKLSVLQEVNVTPRVVRASRKHVCHHSQTFQIQLSHSSSGEVCFLVYLKILHQPQTVTTNSDLKMALE